MKKRQALILGWVGYALVRWSLLVNRGYYIDIYAYKRWGLTAVREGISQVYRGSDMDYPPLYAYILAPMAAIYRWLAPDAFRNLQDSTFLTALFKFPPLLFDLAIGWLLWRLAARLRPKSGPWPWTWILPAAYLLNPAVLFNNGYWGEPDAVHSFFALAAFAALGYGVPRRGAWVAWVGLTLATLMKPLGAPFFPLLLILSLALQGWRATLVGIGASLLTVLLVFSPFLAAGQGGAVYHRVIGDVGLMPYTSSNAHNLWWLLGAWRNANAPWLGPITATQFSLALFGLFYAGLLWKAHRLYRAQGRRLLGPQVILLAAAVGFSFFMLATHMHENHMFIVIPLLAPLLMLEGPWRKLFIAVSVAVLANVALHDLVMPERWPFTIGGASGFENHHLKRPFFVTELVAIWVSTVFNLLLYGWFLDGLFRRGWLESLGRAKAPGSPASASRSAQPARRGSY